MTVDVLLLLQLCH